MNNASTQHKCDSQILQHRLWSKTEFCGLAPAWYATYRNRCHTHLAQWWELFSTQREHGIVELQVMIYRILNVIPYSAATLCYRLCKFALWVQLWLWDDLFSGTIKPYRWSHADTSINSYGWVTCWHIFENLSNYKSQQDTVNNSLH